MYQQPRMAVVVTLFALCMVVVVETPTRQLIQPRTPKRGLLLYF